VVIGSALYIFGGSTCNGASTCNSSSTYANISYRFDFATNTWLNLLPLSSITPEPRIYHSMTVANNGEVIVLFGGQTVEFFENNDVWIFNVAQLNWTQLNLQYPLPTPAKGVLLVPYAHNQVLLIGGFNSFSSPANFMNKVTLIDIGVPNNSSVSPNTTSSDQNDLNVVLHFPNNVPSLTFTPVSSCGQDTANNFMRVQINKIEEMYAITGDIHLPAVQTLNFLEGVYSLNTNATLQDQQFDFSRNLGATRFGFQYSLAQQTVSVNYLGTEFQLQPSDLKLTLSVDDWQWAQAYLGPKSPLKLVLRTTIMIYADTPFTNLYSSYDEQSQQTIFSISSQDMEMTLAFSNLASSDLGIQNISVYPYFAQDSVTLLLDLPYFLSNITYDPNFAVLLTTDSCGGPDVLAIVLPSVLGGLAVLTVLVVVIAGLVFLAWRRKLLTRRIRSASAFLSDSTRSDGTGSEGTELAGYNDVEADSGSPDRDTGSE